MLIVTPAEATVGMTLVAPVHNPNKPDQELLKRGFALDRLMLDRLVELGVDYVYVDFPGLDDIDRHVAPFLSAGRQKLCSQIKSAIRIGQESSRPNVSFTEYYDTMREMILTLIAQGKHPIYLDQMSRLGTDEVAHAASVAHLSLLLGLRLERYLVEQRKRLAPKHAREVVNLGVAGMLHDIGKSRLPEHLQQYNSTNLPKTEPELLEWQGHSRLGYEMVHSGIEPSAATAILHHHQHRDGSGFPVTKHRDGTTSRHEGEKIHVFARILHVADLYDRLATSAQKRLHNFQVLHQMRQSHANTCDPTILAALHTICPPYPPGSKVELSDGTSAIVVKVEPTDPYRPILRKLKAKDFEFDGEAFAMRSIPSLEVVSVAGTAVAPYLPTGGVAEQTAAASEAQAAAA